MVDQNKYTKRFVLCVIPFDHSWGNFMLFHEISTIYLSYYKDSILIYQMSIIEHSLIAWAYKHQMCHNPVVYILLSCTVLEKTTNLYMKIPKDQRFASFTDGPASKEVLEFAIETQPPAQKPATKCS